jgi:hypothetical protein
MIGSHCETWYRREEEELESLASTWERRRKRCKVVENEATVSFVVSTERIWFID